MIIIIEAMLKMNRITIYMKAVDMSAGSTTVMEDMEVKVDSLGIMTISHIDPSSVSHARKKFIDTQTAHTRTKPI